MRNNLNLISPGNLKRYNVLVQTSFLNFILSTLAPAFLGLPRLLLPCKFQFNFLFLVFCRVTFVEHACTIRVVWFLCHLQYHVLFPSISYFLICDTFSF